MERHMFYIKTIDLCLSKEMLRQGLLNWSQMGHSGYNTSNILWVILYVILYSFSHNLPLYTLRHSHQYTTPLQSLLAFGLGFFWTGMTTGNCFLLGVQLSLTWGTPGRRRWPAWCPSGTDPHTRGCWVWSEPVERAVGPVMALQWILATGKHDST